MWFFDTPGTPGGASIVERNFLGSKQPVWITFQVCLIWGSGTPATTMTGCCLSSQDFSLCLTRRCQKELPRPCTRDATVLRQLCLMFVWSGVQALLQWLRRAAKYLSSQDFSICFQQRWQKELQGPVVGMLLSRNIYTLYLFDRGFRLS